jgi:hypothetical protein
LTVLAVCCGLGGLAPAAAGDEPQKPEDAAKQATALSSKLPQIDQRLREMWEQSSIKPSPVCSEEEYLRRVYLDVLGRIPTIKEASGYLLSKESGKRQKLVEYLLQQPDYAKNFANLWTVLLIGRRTRDRDVNRGTLSAWLRQQFNADRPWNDIVYDLVTAKGSNKENGAVNFALAHLDSGATPLTSITTRVFLGQQIQCTQCHDHPSNDWKQADFWGINAFFKGLRREQVRTTDASGKEVIDHMELSDEPTDAYATYDKRNGLVGIAYPKFLDGRKISQGRDVERRAELGKFIADPKNMDLARAFVNRMWGHFMGRGIVSPVDDFGPHNPPSHPELLDELAQEFIASECNIKSLIRWITSCQAYHVSSAMTKANEKDETLFSHMALKPMTPEQLFDSLLTATAAHKAGSGEADDRKRDAWLRQFVFAFANDEGDEGSSFQGTIPQALMMMNGDLMDQATGGKEGSFLADVVNEAQVQGRTPAAFYMVNHIYLAALSRMPTTRERSAVQKFIDSYPDTLYVLEDVFWALLNSNEFILNR